MRYRFSCLIDDSNRPGFDPFPEPGLSCSPGRHGNMVTLLPEAKEHHMMKIRFLVASSLLVFFPFHLSTAATGDLIPVHPAENEAAHRPVVAGYERFAEVEEISEVERGLLLLNELGCVQCHSSSETFWSTPARQAPILDEVGQRVVRDYIVEYLKSPHEFKPGTTMPDVLGGKTVQERSKIAESISQFLAQTGSTNHQPTTNAEIQQGRKLFHEVGCVACHNPQQPAREISTSIPLGDLSRKYSVEGLARFIRNPLHARPSGRMPKIDLSGEEVRAIASYLTRSVRMKAEFRFAYYEGRWNRLPDFSKLKPVREGIVSSFGFDGLPRLDNFGVVFSGLIEVSDEGEYVFKTNSDDGSRLWVDGQRVVDNDGIHGMKTATGKVRLKAGFHEVRIEYFENSGGEKLLASMQAPGGAEIDLATRLMKEKPVRENRKPDLSLVAEGQTHFVSIGCANCHSLEVDGAPLQSTFAAQKPLDQLDPSRGCVAGGETSPNYQFDQRQKQSLSAALKYLSSRGGGSANSLSNDEQVHQHLVSLNCYACHSREIGTRGEDDFRLWGGIVDKTGGESLEVFERDPWFVGTEAEMGDEGRHPPDLKLAGAKLKQPWLKKLLSSGARDRPYMKTRMPGFGETNAQAIGDALVQADKLPRKIEVRPTEPTAQLKSHGRFMVGAKGLSCIKCHTFGEFPSSGIPAISLTTMTRRLNKDWFQVYMLKPSQFRRGTRMPESWPGGKSFFEDRLDGDPDRQIDAIWQYLSDGADAKQPTGLVKTKMEVVADKTPVIYRNFIQGAGPRAIGVGYPERVNIAFDAQNCRMALMWQENFIDGGRHWTGRGQGYEPPLGEKIIQLGDHLPFLIPSDETPELKYRSYVEPALKNMSFQGYRLDENRRPQFKYKIGSFNIDDKPVPRVVDEVTHLTRQFRLEGPGKKLVYVAAVGNKIVATDSGFDVDGTWRTSIDGNVEVAVSKMNGKYVILVTADLSSGPVKFEQKYDWK